MNFLRTFFLLVVSSVLFAEMSDKWIIVTTIQHPTSTLKKLAQLPGWQLLVIGDKKTPTNWYLDEKCIYLSPYDQERLPFKLAKLLPWNHYVRKNLGYLYAIAHGAQMIYDTDDDNYIPEAIRSFGSDSDIVTLDSAYCAINVYSYYDQPSLWPRGFPLSIITKNNEIRVVEESHHKKIVIEQGLVNGEPDVDAIFRLTRQDNTNISFNKNKPACVLAPGKFCPFNTQNTLIQKEAFWGLYIPTYVPFRVCDIWRGYLTQRLLWETDTCICFTPPTAIQERNAHDFMKDFLGELDLYTKTEGLINFLSSWKPKAHGDVFENLNDLYLQAIEHKFIGSKEEELIRAWIQDLKSLGIGI